MTFKYIASLLVFMCAVLLLSPVRAQDSTLSTQDVTVAPNAPSSPDGGIAVNPASVEEVGDPNNRTLAPEEMMLRQVADEMKAELERLDKLDKGVPSLFFNEEERGSLAQALIDYDNGVVPSLEEDEEEEVEIPHVSTVSLNGIYYQSPSKWIVWINNTRVDPGALLPEMKSITVHKDYVEMEWNNLMTGELLPIRIRPNQTFNIDLKAFTPG